MRWVMRLVATTVVTGAIVMTVSGPAAAAWNRLGEVSVGIAPRSVQVHLVAAQEGDRVRGECGLHRGYESRRMLTCVVRNVNTGFVGGTNYIRPEGFQPPSVIVEGRSNTLQARCGNRYTVGAQVEVLGYARKVWQSIEYTVRVNCV